MMKQYRIGDFARELGVTPDFLKYCEKQGVLTPHAEANGYRYYSFTQAAQVIEYLKFKNQGYTAREIAEEMKKSSFAGSIDRLQIRKAEIERHIAYEQALLEYADYLQQIQPYFQAEPVWHVCQLDEFYFLPHSRDMDFIGGQTRKYIQAWNAFMPIVASAKCLPRAEDGTLCTEGRGMYWGYAVHKGFAKKVRLAVDGPVVCVPKGRYLEVFQRREMTTCSDRYAKNAQEIAARCGLRTAGDAYSIILAKIMENGIRVEYSVMYLPIEG